MKPLIPVVILGLVLAVLALRLSGRLPGRRAGASGRAPGQPAPARRLTSARRGSAEPVLGATGLVAAREVRERFRGWIYRAGTLLIPVAVAAVIVIPALQHGKSRPQQVGVAGALAAPLRAAVAAAAVSVGTTAHLVPEADVTAARDSLRAGRIDLAIIGAREVLVTKPIQPADTSTTAEFVRAAARTLGVTEAFQAAGLSAAQAAQIAGAKALPVTSLQPGGTSGTVRSTSIIGLVLVFFMLIQYNTWTLIGVMEEKSSRVVEVLLAAIRPVQLLAGKVLGIGLVALTQAALIVAVAVVAAKAVGSDLLNGTAPVVLVATLAWLVLGYAFYCWVFAAAGSMAERRDQVQTLVFPLSLPIIFGYTFAITVASSGSPSTFFKVLAYLPPTAPFAMPVLVGLGAVSWWEFAVSVAISILCTAAVARLAAGIYRRSILRTGRRVRLREVISGTAR